MSKSNNIPSTDKHLHLHDRDYIWVDIDPETSEVTHNEVLEPSIQSFIDSLDTFKTLPLDRSSDPMFKRVVFSGEGPEAFHTHDGTFLLEDEEVSDGSYKGKTVSLSTDAWSTMNEAGSEVVEGTTSKDKIAAGEKAKVLVTKKTLTKAVRAEGDGEGSSNDDETTKRDVRSRTEVGLAAACTAVIIAGIWVLER